MLSLVSLPYGDDPAGVISQPVFGDLLELAWLP